MRLRPRPLIVALLLIFAFTLRANARETPAEHAANVYAAKEVSDAPRHGNLPDYTLPPADLARAQHLASVRTSMHFASEVWGILQMLLLLWAGAIAWMRDRAEVLGAARSLQLICVAWVFLVFTLLVDLIPTALTFLVDFSPKLRFGIDVAFFVGSALLVWMQRHLIRRWSYRWVQGYAFLLLFLLAGFLLDLPLELYGHHVSRIYGLSIQGWGSWIGDLAKSFGLEWIFGGLVLMLLFWIIRKVPDRWWAVFWIFTIPITMFGLFIGPYVEPIFFHYEPLGRTQPALVARLEQVAERGHMNIPADRMFLMQASAKLTTLNADVEGFGRSKRVVVWDTSIQKFTPDEILLVFGHESGHYVLGHIVRGLILSFVGSFVLLYLGFRFVHWAIARFGRRWRIGSAEDWGALAVLVLGFSLFGAALEPITAGISREQEHAADVYGQEAVHGIVADPQAAAKGAFDVLGQTSLADPNPSRWLEFWTYDHPATGRRAAFGKAYDPWMPGYAPKYFPAAGESSER